MADAQIGWRIATRAATATLAGESAAKKHATPAAQASSSTLPSNRKKPVACIVLGMAGAGKTTLMQRLNAYLHAERTPYYLVNLDPAVLDTPFGANIDIRDTVNYKEVMRQYNLGPNGGILTSLNLFATRFEDVLKLIEARKNLRYVMVDTPGQIEIFTWSASGAIISESLGSTMPTVIVYVVDTPRSANAVTFMSNMLYACSILYKAKLPLLVVFNKIDVTPHHFAVDWMTDLTAFQEALQAEKSYMGTLATSMALMLEEFYNSLSVVGVSAMTGAGIPAFFEALEKAADEYEETYGAELQRRQEAKAAAEEARQKEANAHFSRDREAEVSGAAGLEAAGARVVLDGRRHRGGGSDDEESESEDEAGGAGYTREDEEWGQENPDEAADREEYESLARYLQKRKG